MEICSICGRPAQAKHHLVFGRGLRKLADEDGLIIPLCNACHNMHIMSTCKIHDNSVAEKLSKMLGQTIWEINYCTTEKERERAREAFRKRYGKSYL